MTDRPMPSYDPEEVDELCALLEARWDGVVIHRHQLEESVRRVRASFNPGAPAGERRFEGWAVEDEGEIRVVCVSRKYAEKRAERYVDEGAQVVAILPCTVTVHAPSAEERP